MTTKTTEQTEAKWKELVKLQRAERAGNGTTKDQRRIAQLIKELYLMATHTEHPAPQPKHPGSEWVTATTIMEGVPRLVVAEVRWRDQDARAVKGKAYVWGADPLKPHPPFSEKGEDPELDAQWRAYNRLEVKLMRQALQAVVVGGPSWAFNVRAGCWCRCSPGFVDQSGTLFTHRDIFIQVR